MTSSTETKYAVVYKKDNCMVCDDAQLYGMNYDNLMKYGFDTKDEAIEVRKQLDGEGSYHLDNTEIVEVQIQVLINANVIA